MPNANTFVSAALACIGKPYKLGSTDISAFDCSSLVQYAAAEAGLQLPRTAALQSKEGQEITRADLTPGDLIFFDFEAPPTAIRHVGIYTGDGKMVNAQSESPAEVCIASIDTGYWSKRILGFRRVFGVVETAKKPAATETATAESIAAAPSKKPADVLM